MPLWWRQLARRYAHAVATPPTIAAGELCLAAGDLDQDLEHLIARGPRRCPRERLLVYQRQYWLRLIDVLQTELPTLVPLLGIDAFNHLALRYLIAYPPDAAELHRLTRHWPHWQALIGGPTHLVQAARWDVQRAELFAAPAPPAGPGLPTVPWRAWQGPHPGADGAAGGCWVRWRHQDGSIRHRKVSVPALRFLRLLHRHGDLDAACAAWGAAHPHRATQMAEWFATWASWGWFECCPMPILPATARCKVDTTRTTK
jgi:hypothetical protein